MEILDYSFHDSCGLIARLKTCIACPFFTSGVTNQWPAVLLLTYNLARHINSLTDPVLVDYRQPGREF